jgi:hypothetical protein
MMVFLKLYVYNITLIIEDGDRRTIMMRAKETITDLLIRTNEGIGRRLTIK